MSRLDWFTIAVVGICILAIAFLLWKTSDLINKEDSLLENSGTEITTGDGSNFDDDDVFTDETIEPDNFDDNDDMANEDNEAVASKDGESSEGYATDDDEDMDDSESGMEESMEDEESTRVNTSPSANAYSSGGDFMVVAGSFAQMINAENMVKNLQKKGFASAEVGKFNAGKYATALAGRFDSQAEAQALVSELKGQGIEAYIQKRK